MSDTLLVLPFDAIERALWTRLSPVAAANGANYFDFQDPDQQLPLVDFDGAWAENEEDMDEWPHIFDCSAQLSVWTEVQGFKLCNEILSALFNELFKRDAEPLVIEGFERHSLIWKTPKIERPTGSTLQHGSVMLKMLLTAQE